MVDYKVKLKFNVVGMTLWFENIKEIIKKPNN